MAPQREVPKVFKQLLEVDKKVTKKFNILCNRVLPIGKCRPYFKALELSCHGIPWFAFWICFTWLFNNQSLIQMQVNMLLGLTLDILFVAVVKAYVRRRRPVANTDDALGQFGPDQFSFPSGHASRAIFITYFFLHNYPLHMFFVHCIFLWAIAVCISRILMNRHHILDVLAGVGLGVFVGMLDGLLYVNEDTAKWLMSFLSDEKLDGGEYHV